MRDDFCAFILTHGRAANVQTYKALRGSGYTGKIYLVIDDEDSQGDEYRARYGDEVLVFSKDAIAARFDQGDNFTDRRVVFYARNACWELAERVGCRWFIQLDDDYSTFGYRLLREGKLRNSSIRSMDMVLEAMIIFLSSTGSTTVAMGQGGDHIGPAHLTNSSDVKLRRKAMNSFVCDSERPFAFVGRINEDVNTYISRGNAGDLFFTYLPLQLTQAQTQKQAGGMTEVYLDSGTYVKSFYSVMYAPSCVRVGFVQNMRRAHHVIAREDSVPKILHERHRRAPR